MHVFEQAAPAPDQGFRDAPSGEGCGQEHVFQRFQLREKLEVLKDETDMLPAPAIALVFGQRAGHGRAPAYGSPVRKHKPAHDVEERAFARSRSAPDADVFAGCYFKVRYVKNRPPPPAFGKGEEDILKFQPVHTRSLVGRRLQLAETGVPQPELADESGIRIAVRSDFQHALHLNGGVVLDEALVGGKVDDKDVVGPVRV